VLEFLHVSLTVLAAQEFAPRGEQVFHRNDIFIGMSANTPQTAPPPQESAPDSGAYQTSLFAVAHVSFRAFQTPPILIRCEN
jgi:hypothetical protein